GAAYLAGTSRSVGRGWSPKATSYPEFFTSPSKLGPLDQDFYISNLWLRMVRIAVDDEAFFCVSY
ncbi:MAG: hypothetical protein J7M30_07020, partial [Deltaproteobacteria bacterium]|nr:hypothetical protein [Deltaproteobacteria bacterium]